MKHLVLMSLCVLLTSFVALPARAGECYEYPTIPLNGSATVNSGVFLRTTPCMADSEVLSTLSGGSVVPVLGEQDGWYNVKDASGLSGWVWGSFLTVSQSPYVAPTTSYTPKTTTAPQTTSSSLLSRVKGRILLQTQQHGEAWYVNPADGKRYYMKDGPTAYEMMRAFGLGISNANLALAQAGNTTVLAAIKGKIVLQVEAHGEAYYVLPTDGTLHYLKDGEAAYTIMRELSLGITDADLSLIPSSEFVPLSSSQEKVSETISRSTFTHTSVGEEIDTVALNEVWLEKVNALRAEADLQTLVLDQRLVDTASEYAGIMADEQYTNHERPDGSSAHEWIKQKGIDFTEWKEEGGWQTNYFSENIAWSTYEKSQAGYEQLLDAALRMFLEEGMGGAHYETLYHADWNRVGVGVSASNGRTYAVFHYGSLE